LVGISAGIYTIEVQPGWGSTYSSRRFRGVTIDAHGNCTTASGGDEDGDENACDLNTLAGVGDGTAVRVGTPNLIGQILDINDNPVQNAWVMVHTSNWMQNAGGNADQNGAFRIGGLEDSDNYAVEINVPWGMQIAGVVPDGLSVSVEDGVGTVKKDGEALAGNVINLVAPTKLFPVPLPMTGKP